MATTDLATLRVNVIAQTRDFERGMGRVRKDTKSVGQNLRDIGRQAAMFTAAAAGVGFLAKKTFDLGAAVEETASKYRTVFGPAVGEVNAFLERNARVMGLTDREAQDLVATTGAIVQGMGLGQRASAEFSVEIAKLAGDFASFNNIPIEETSRAIQAALTGERESLKRLGVVILEADVQKRALANTGKENAKALTQQEKAYASLELIAERAGVQVGDLNRTQESSANVFRRVAAEARQFRDDIATGLIPALSVFLGMADDSTSSLTEMGEAFKRSGEDIAAVARLILRVSDFFIGMIRVSFNIGQLLGEAANAVGAVIAGDVEEQRKIFFGMQKQLDDLKSSFEQFLDAFTGRESGSGGGISGGVRRTKDEVEGLTLIIPEVVGGLNDIQRAAQGIAGAFTDSVADSVMGAKDAFKDFINFAIAELARLAAKFAVFKILETAFPGATSAGGLLEGMFNFGGARAHGGPTRRGESYLVGERGPELFTPNQSGTVHSNGSAVTLNVSGMPPATNPLAMARDKDWLAFLNASNRELAASGA